MAQGIKRTIPARLKSSLLRTFSRRTPAEQRQDDAAQRLRDIRFADTLRVSGEAIILTISVTDSHGAVPAGLPVNYIRSTVESRVQKIEPSSRNYYVQKMIPNDNDLCFYIHGHDRLGRTTRYSRSNQGERWVVAIGDFDYKLRSTIESKLHKEWPDKELCIASSWKPGKGVVVSSGLTEDSETTRNLVEDLWARRIKEEHLKRVKLIYGTWTALLVVTGIWILVLWAYNVNLDARFYEELYGIPADDPQARYDNLLTSSTIGIYVLTIGVMGALLTKERHDAHQRVKDDIREILSKIDLRGVDNPKERHAYKLFQLNSSELKRYYDQALRQRSWVFILGVACILAGFACIIVAISIIRVMPDTEIEAKIVVAILGGVGAILADFVAVIFLRMFSAIVASSVDFHLRLVGTHHAHFGNVLAAKITNPDVTDQTLAKLAVALGSQVSPRAKDAAEDQPQASPDKSGRAASK